MYHDEFAKRSAWNRDRKPIGNRDDLMPSAAMEAGGGLSLGLAASLDPSLSLALYYLGGLLPLVASSLTIAAHRATEWLACLVPTTPAPVPSALPVPHLAPARSRAAGPMSMRNRRAGSIRRG